MCFDESAIERAALAQTTPDRELARVIAWHHLAYSRASSRTSARGPAIEPGGGEAFREVVGTFCTLKMLRAITVFRGRFLRGSSAAVMGSNSTGLPVA
jgi:hypothetical protein